MKDERTAKFVSNITIWLIMSIGLILIEFLIEDVNQTLYPCLASLLLIYLAIGDFVMQHKGINPLPSTAIRQSKLDSKWALKHLYWSCWWPMYL